MKKLILLFVLVFIGTHVQAQVPKFDKLEMQDGESENPLLLEGQGWIGQDLNKFWLKTEVEREDGKTEEAELQALYSKGVSPFWDFQGDSIDI